MEKLRLRRHSTVLPDNSTLGSEPWPTKDSAGEISKESSLCYQKSLKRHIKRNLQRDLFCLELRADSSRRILSLESEH